VVEGLLRSQRKALQTQKATRRPSSLKGSSRPQKGFQQPLREGTSQPL
jgi:hypothetical protein